MRSGKAEARKLKKRKERERRIALERHLRRNAPSEIEDLPFLDEEDEDDDHDAHEEVPLFNVERFLRHVARQVCNADPEKRQTRQKAVESIRDSDLAELVAQIPADAHEDRAQELAFQALESEDQEKAECLARRALDLDPDCADARCVLALRHPDAKDRIAGLTEAVAAAERALERPSHEACAESEVYADVYRRPCERAHTRLAEELVKLGRMDEALAQYRIMIDLDDEDFQGMRFPLVLVLLERGDAEGAREILDRFPRNRTSLLAWARVLERFLSGDGVGACRALRRARKASSDIEDLLLEEVLPCVGADDYHFDEGENADIVALLMVAWLRHREALLWLEDGGCQTTPEERQAALASYSHPVATLLTRGALEPKGPWREDASAGFGPQHVAELVRMAGDPALHESDPDSPAVWAPVHAWRALARLGAVEAVRPLAELLRERHDDDWVIDDMPGVFVALGPAALAAMAELVGDPEADEDARGVAARAMGGIAAAHPERRNEVVSRLLEVLEEQWEKQWEESSVHLDSILAAQLVDLGAKDAGPLLREMFEEDMIDESLVGSWQHVMTDLGLDPSGNPVR